MLFAIPNTKITARVFERVKTEDQQYDIVDLGVQYENGGIDSLAVGGSFYSLKEAVRKNNAGLTETKQQKEDTTVAPSEPVEPPAVTGFDGAEQDIEGL